MIKRVVEISNPARLCVKHHQLVIETDAGAKDTVPIEDLGVLLLSNPIISITQAVHFECAANNTVIVSCDDKYLPSAILLPLTGHVTQAKITRAQATASQPCRKRLWQLIVRHKIKEQALALETVGAGGNELRHLINKVKSGDPANVESHAARLYWQKLFGEGFRRLPDAPGINGLLNYGYAVIRAATARAVVGCGLCPVFGLKHCNQFNYFSLVDDLVEPFRPWVDTAVYGLMCEYETDQPITIGRREKEVLLGLLIMDCRFRNKTFPFMVALHHYAANVRDILCGEQTKMEFIYK